MPVQNQAPAAALAAPPPASAETLLSVRGVRKSFAGVEVLRRVSLEVREAEFLTILGESGSGKTTLLRLIAGFEQQDAGEIWMQGERLDLLPPFRRRVNTVFQQYALFPHLSVFENVAYGLRAERVSKAEIAERVTQALALVKMSAFARSRPGKISGGQQQRVALARAVVKRPRMLLLDEPLSALDASLRRQMQGELKALQRELGITFLFVTHDQEEALALSDRIAVLQKGALEQVAAPREIYLHPATAYVAQFIGQTNLLRAEVRSGRGRAGALSWSCPLPEGEADFSLRPECIFPAAQISRAAEAELVRFRARIAQRTFQGPASLLELECGELRLLARIAGAAELAGEQEFAFSARDLTAIAGGRA